MYTNIKVLENGQVIRADYSDGTSKIFTQCYPQNPTEFKCYESQYNGTVPETILFFGALFCVFGIGYIGYMLGSIRSFN